MRPSFYHHLHPPTIPARQARLRYYTGDNLSGAVRRDRAESTLLVSAVACGCSNNTHAACHPDWSLCSPAPL